MVRELCSIVCFKFRPELFDYNVSNDRNCNAHKSVMICYYTFNQNTITTKYY